MTKKSDEDQIYEWIYKDEKNPISGWLLVVWLFLFAGLIFGIGWVIRDIG